MLLKRINIAREVLAYVTRVQLVDLIAAAGRNRGPIARTGERVAHAQDRPVSGRNIPVECPVRAHPRGEIDDVVRTDLRGRRRRWCRHDVIYIHQTAEGTLVLPSPHASLA